jgi:hypothetical protein
MTLSNGMTGGLVEQYNEIVGDSDKQKSIDEDEFRIEYFSMYEKSDYETRTYSNLNNFK